MKTLLALLFLTGCTRTDPALSPTEASFELVAGESARLKVNGLAIAIPEGALPQDVEVRIGLPEEERPLPEAGRFVGPELEFTPPVRLLKPATVTAGYVPKLVADEGVDIGFVRVWTVAPDGWTVLRPSETASDGLVTVELTHLERIGAGIDLNE